MSTSGVVESMRDEMEKILSEKLAVLQRQLEMTQQAIPPMKEMTNSWTSLQKISENVQALHKGLENMQVATKEDLHMLRAELEERVPKAWNTPKRSESEENLLQVEDHAGEHRNTQAGFHLPVLDLLQAAQWHIITQSPLMRWEGELKQ